MGGEADDTRRLSADAEKVQQKVRGEFVTKRNTRNYVVDYRGDEQVTARGRRWEPERVERRGC